MPINNNDAEREIRDMVMGKKAYLYCRTEEDCQRAAMMYSLLDACKALGKDPEKWIAHTLKHIGSTKPENLHRLLPEEWAEQLVLQQKQALTKSLLPVTDWWQSFLLALGRGVDRKLTQMLRH